MPKSRRLARLHTRFVAKDPFYEAVALLVLVLECKELSRDNLREDTEQLLDHAWGFVSRNGGIKPSKR